MRKRIDELSEILDFDEDARVYAVSSQNGVGIAELREGIDQLLFNTDNDKA